MKIVCVFVWLLLVRCAVFAYINSTHNGKSASFVVDAARAGGGGEVGEGWVCARKLGTKRNRLWPRSLSPAQRI